MADDESMVAIVQGLQDAGLAVTVLNRRLLRARKPYRRPLASRSSVETNTDKSYYDIHKINRGTNVIDGHYASSYQIAHCNARPTSPPQHSPGFPPQRSKPSRTDGNFELGGNYYVPDTAVTSPTRSYRGFSDRYIDTGSIYTNNIERVSHETFAHSLRRYPTFSPERSISTELVQKLLSYTQNKYLTKPTSKSQRSLTRDKSPQSVKLDAKPSKNIQTYARTKRQVTTRDCGANTSHDLRFMTKKGKSNSVIRESRYKDEHTTPTSYVYLEQPPSSSSRQSGRPNEVRYIRDVKRYIRDTIRQIYDDRPMAVLQVCPKIKSRYSHHRRLYHKGQDQIARSGQSIDIQTSVPTTSKATTFGHYCEPPPGSHSHVHKYASVSTSDVIMCCTCNRPIPCVCKMKEEKAASEVRQHITDWINELPLVFSENSRENKKEKERVIKEIEEIISEIPKDEKYDENVKEAITSYIEELPIWDAVDNEDDYGFKNGIIDSFMDRFQSVEDKTTTAIKDVAKKCLDSIQFDRNIDIDKTANNFAAHLTHLLTDNDELKTKLYDLLLNLPITDKEDAIDDIHKNFTNDLIKLSNRVDAPVLLEEELQNEINEFLENFPDVFDKGCNVKNLARKFRNTQSKPISESEKEKQMKGNVVDWIDSLPKSIRDKFTPNEVEEFANALVDKVQGATHLKAISNERKSSFQIQQQIENDIWDLLKSMDVDRDEVDESIVKGYAFHLKEMEKTDFDEEDILNETNDFLDELDKSGVGMRSRDQDEFQKGVYDKLKQIQAKNRKRDDGRAPKGSFVTSTPRKGAASHRSGLNVSSIGDADESSYSIADPPNIRNAEKQYSNQLNEQIESWVENLPINLGPDKKNKKALINELANDIIDRQKYLQIHPSAAKSDAEELENLKYQVFRWLNKINNVKDNEMASVMDKTKTLMDKIKNVDVPQFGKSSLKPLTRDKYVKSPYIEKSVRSPTREISLRSPREQSYNSSPREHSSGSVTGKKSIGSPTKVKNVRSPNREHSFGTTTYIPTQDTSMFIKENLDGAITDWIKQLPLYDKASSEQKRKFEELVPEISKGIKKVYGEIDNLEQDVDKLVIDEIEKQIKNLPISSEDKKNKKFMNQIATQLLQYLKDQQIFQDISDRVDASRDAEALEYQTSDGVGPGRRKSRDDKTVTINELKSVGDNLSGAITDWMKQQPAYLENKAELDKLIPNLSEKVRSMPKGRDQDKVLIDEITKQLKNTPLESEDSETATQLVQYMKDLQMLQENPETTTQVTLEDLNSTMNNFANNLDLKKVTWAEKKSFGNLKSGLATKIKDLLDKGADRNTLKKDIKQYLSKFPLSENELRDDSFLDKKAEELIDSLPSNSNSPDVYSYVRKGFMKWMKNLPLEKGKDLNDISKEAIGRITKRLSDQIIHTDTITIADTKKLIEDETNRFLQEVPLDENKSHDPKKLANDLFDCIKGSSTPTNRVSPNDNTAKGFIPTSYKDNNIAQGSIQLSSKDNTAKGSAQTSSKDKTAKGSIPMSSKDNTAKGSTPISSKDNTAKGSSKDRTAKGSVQKSSKDKTTKGSILTSPKDKASKGSIPTSSKDNNAMISISTSTRTLLSDISGSMHPSFKSAAEQLADNVEHWVNDLPIKEKTLEDKSKASNLRRQLSARILSKVGELNTNPDIFNDDFLYEEMFEDEVDDMIKVLPDEDLKKVMPAHKKSLIEIVKDARLKTQDEMAGPVYKQQLREVVSQKVPTKSLNEEEIASFEVLKEDVADAFVAIHYVKDVNGNVESKTQFKNNVKREIDEFCADYLKNHPGTAVDTDKINNDLYMALKDVPVPNDEIMRHEIEIIKIKEVIHNWIDEGKLFGDQTGADKLLTTKKISVLAKKIHDIEKLKDSNPDLDSDDMLKKEIKKWLQKMPLVVTDDLDMLAERLIENLKETEESRKQFESTRSGKESTMPASSYSKGARTSTDSNSRRKVSLITKSCCSKPEVLSKVFRRSVVSPNSRILCNCPEYEETPASRPVSVDISPEPKLSDAIDETAETSTAPDFTIVPFPCAPPCAVPPSTLSSADREYLKKIRERSTQPTKQNSPRSSKDAEVSPIPIDNASQTEITVDITTTTQGICSHTQSSIQTSKPVETAKPEVQAAGSQVEVVPHIIVKEYYWDSIDSKMNPCSIITCPPSQVPEITCPRSSYPCPLRTSHHAQTTPPAPEEFYPDSSYFLPDFPDPCTSRPRRGKQSHHNVGPKPKCSIRNLDWSKEECYGARREPSEEEIFIDNITTCGRKNLNFRCKDRMPLTSNGTKKRGYKLCRTPDNESLKRCPKCCGVHCPFPSYLYFNNNQ